MGDAVTTRQTEELRPGVLVRAKPLSIQIGHEK
jgi:hypothetical protein